MNDAVATALAASRLVPCGGHSLRTIVIPIAARHGIESLHAALGIAPARLAALARRSGELAIRDAVFLDVETTGFAGDDTLVFLVCAARFERDGLRLDQWLLDIEAAEADFLAAVLPALATASPLITFVGKSFDRHRLDDRFERHGRGRPLAVRPHADLYHAARRVFGPRLEDSRLATFESQLLGIHRRGDLRGRECPEAWLDYLESRDLRHIERVLDHCALDVLALVALLARIDSALAAPKDAVEAAEVGLLYVASGRPDLALPALAVAAEAARRDRHPRLAEAARAWERLH